MYDFAVDNLSYVLEVLLFGYTSSCKWHYPYIKTATKLKFFSSQYLIMHGRLMTILFIYTRSSPTNKYSC